MNSSQMLALAVQNHQAGKFGEAEALYRQVLQVEPRNPDALHLLGVIVRQFNRNDVAVNLIRAALRERPSMAAAHSNLGTALQALGQLDEAVASYRRAIQLDANYAEAYNNLGNALQNQGKRMDAVACFQRAVELKPDDAGKLTNLGVALQSLGRLDEALTCHQRAIRLMPNNADAHSNLGSVLQEQGKPEQAVASYEQALRIKPDHVDALSNLGIVLLTLGKFDEAVAREEQALRLRPNYAVAHNNLGVVLAQRGRLDEAMASYTQAVRLNPCYTDAYRNLGRTQLSQGKLNEALASHEQVVRLLPKSPAAHFELGNVRQELGDFAGSEQAFRAALQLDPGHVDALWGLAMQKRGNLPDADRAMLEQRLGDPKLPDTDASKIHFVLAQLSDARGDYENAADHLRKANALKFDACRKQNKGYELEENTRFVERVLATFTPEFFERMRGAGLETKQPVFVFGLPRSGTTLTEQILAAHSQVFGAGELFLAQEDFKTLGTSFKDGSAFTALAELHHEAAHRLAQQHLTQLWNYNRTAERIVDKMPDNYMSLGLLAVLFPKATYIHCRRDLRDVALSCWMTALPSPWSNHLEHIVTRLYEYHRVMEHWRAVLPVPMLEIDYEETVADLEGVARRLVDFCGLPWEPACLKFNEGARPVRTASRAQVREPVYKSSVARWRNYEPYLGELFAALTPLQEKGS